MVSATIGKTQFAGEFCADHAEDISRALVQLGMKPTKAQVGHTKRGVYITGSGRPFTAREARTWLKQSGFDVADAGKLTTDQLMMYAQAN